MLCVTDMFAWILMRYGLHQIGFWLAVVWGIMVIILFCGDVFEIVRYTAGQVSTAHIMALSALKIPGHTAHFVPFLAFAAMRIALWRFTKRGEMLALFAMGVSAFFWVRLIVVLSALLGVVHVCVLQPTSASLQTIWQRCESRWTQRNTTCRFAVATSGIWLRETDCWGERTIHAQYLHDQTLQQVEVHEWVVDRDGRTTCSYVQAHDAQLKGHKWLLHQARVLDGSDRHGDDMCDTYVLATKLTWDDVINTQMEPESISMWRVHDRLPLIERVGLSVHPYLMHWHRHVAYVGLIAGCLLWALVISKWSMVWMTSGLLVYFMNDVVQALGQAQQMPIILSVWCVPLVLMLVCTGLVIHREERV